MIRFKRNTASAVPTPPAGYATLFVDDATGLPAAKDSSGEVISLKGADGSDGTPGEGIPGGGTVGQVVTKTSGGIAWADVPTGAPSGTWMNLLPPDGEATDDVGTLLTASVRAAIDLAGGSSPTINLTRDLGTSVVTRLRGSATVVLDVNKTDTGLPAAGAFVLAIGAEHFPVVQGTNTITFEFSIAPDFGLESSEYWLQLLVIAQDADNVASAWAEVTVTQCDVLASDSGDVTTTALTMTSFAVLGLTVGSGGGCLIEKAGSLAAVTTIEVVGYYPIVADALASATSFYASRWLNEATYVPVSPAAAIPVFGSGAGEKEGDWGWDGGDSFESTIPLGQWSICKVKVDGAAEVFARLCNLVGS